MARERRSFLKSTAAAVAGLAMPCDNKATNFLIAEATSAEQQTASCLTCRFATGAAR